MTKELSVVAHDTPPLDVTAIRQDFPILRQPIRGIPLAYLDNASTTQKPRAVIARLASFYAEENANVHRGVHWLSERHRRPILERGHTRGNCLRARDHGGDQPRRGNVGPLAGCPRR
jgi:selenocysteine lyase/cysteine desulfurase